VAWWSAQPPLWRRPFWTLSAIVLSRTTPPAAEGENVQSLIASPFQGSYVVLRPGRPGALKISQSKYRELACGGDCPAWLAEAAAKAWNLDLIGRPIAEHVLVRTETVYGFGHATYELNLGCNYDCEHCYLGLKRFEGMVWDDRCRILEIMRDAGVVSLQLTGGEPMIDRLFPQVYEHAHGLGMAVDILTNGSRLANRKILDLLTDRPANLLTVSVYGATAESYDGLTRRPGSYRTFMNGLQAAHEAGVRLALALIIVDRNAHEAEAMKALAAGFGVLTKTYSNITPTIYGGAETLPSQSSEYLVPNDGRKPFRGCDAGRTAFHVNPHGMASICKVGREPNVSLLEEGVEGLTRLADIADGLLRRQGGCTGCQWPCL
jgi:MoaA/NifB/PqqE/SkfB family radical SAM enzyme